MRYRSIVISGQIASGTTTAAKNVAQKLNLKHESAGDFFRKYALEHNIPLYDKQKIPDELDYEIDAGLKRKAKEGGYVIDAHYLGALTTEYDDVLKVLLICNEGERYKRALNRKHTHQETIEDIKKREIGLDEKFRLLSEKFRALYRNDDFLNPKFFDLVIDTTNISQEETASKIETAFNA